MSLAQSMKPNNSQLRRCVMTLNNYNDDEYLDLRRYKSFKAGIIGREVGKDGTPHLQCAFLMKGGVRFSTLKRKFPRAHIEKMAGTPEQAFEYCRKDGNFEEWGDLPKPGKRNDLRNACAAIQEGKTLGELAADPELASTYVRNYRGLRALANEMAMKQSLREKKVVWLYGATGTGKTRFAADIAKIYGDYWMSSGSLQWFDGYSNNRVAILDDLRTDHCKFSFLLRLLDRYELRVPVKGDFVRWNPEFIFITAPYSPKDMWNLRREGDINQLERRCSNIIEMPASMIDQMCLDSLKQKAEAAMALTVADISTQPMQSDSDAEDEAELIPNPTEVNMPELTEEMVEEAIREAYRNEGVNYSDTEKECTDQFPAISLMDSDEEDWMDAVGETLECNEELKPDDYFRQDATFVCDVCMGIDECTCNMPFWDQ